ncbi:MAG: Fur family transcriptional regulator [Candidatus Puniceispirillaceae bacterium]
MKNTLRSKQLLTKNQSLVLEALRKAKNPVGAYELLDQLREHGLRAPLQIYRTLDQLIELKIVHRLESLNAWTLCCDAEHDSTPVFAICNDCGIVREYFDETLSSNIANISKQSGFVADRSIIEIHGRCDQCEPTPDELV